MRLQRYNKKMNQQNFTGFFSNKYMFIQRARLFSLLLPVTCYQALFPVPHHTHILLPVFLASLHVSF